MLCQSKKKYQPFYTSNYKLGSISIAPSGYTLDSLAKLGNSKADT